MSSMWRSLLAAVASVALAVPASAADKITLGFMATLSGPNPVVGMANSFVCRPA